ncbi:hypothetical protein D3875_04105 [Deinococcus cavernae]|uniref:Uncharacterized protein n=1 Tax=Deinococcus cavernae TaxID=2320857 RepID=A0A418VED5_9DEIO|nr:hypothetical protein [Deinococcus cavernae]RJF74470.1 hypothetical protein D3875_04105 [Deinococcus cavernae]
MTAQLALFAADGSTSASFFDFLTVKPGESKQQAFSVVNKGDAPSTDSRLRFADVGSDALWGWLKVTLSGTDYVSPNPVPLGPLAAGQQVNFTLSITVPADAEATTRPLSALLIPEWVD